MQNLVPTQLPVPDFTPVPRKYRYDGWTPERQRAFIAALAETGSVKAACRRINMSQVGAYYLRRQPGADSFRAAWHAALDHGVQALTDIAIERAVEGVPVPVFWRGEQVGEKRRFNDRLLMFILKHHLPARYGAKPLPEGTKHPDTIAREAAEAARAEADAWLAGQCTALGRLVWLHRLRLRAAVQALLAGDQPAAADHEHHARAIETIIDTRPDTWATAADSERLYLSFDVPGMLPETPEAEAAERRHCRPLAETIAAGEATFPEDAPTLATLPRHRDGSLIPALPLPKEIRNGPAMTGGPTINERESARRAVETRIRQAQQEWLATATEEAWARWRQGGG